MNRDHLLMNVMSGLVGVLVGFVIAYPVFEVMSARQPPLRPPGQAGPAPGAAAPGGAAATGGGPAAEEVRRLREIIENDPGNADAILALANLNLSIQDFIRARDLLDRYVALRPGEPQALRTLANLHFETNQYAEARDGYLRYLELAPEDPDVLTDLGTSYRNLEEPQRALELFRRAQKLRPDDWISRFNEVVVLAFDLGDYDAADRVLEELKALQPDNPQVSSLAAEVERRRSG